MSRPQRTTLHLAVDLTSEPIEGEVRSPSGPVHPFVGWLGLAAALERAALPTADDDLAITQDAP